MLIIQALLSTTASFPRPSKSPGYAGSLPVNKSKSPGYHKRVKSLGFFTFISRFFPIFSHRKTRIESVTRCPLSVLNTVFVYI